MPGPRPIRRKRGPANAARPRETGFTRRPAGLCDETRGRRSRGSVGILGRVPARRERRIAKRERWRVLPAPCRVTKRSRRRRHEIASAELKLPPKEGSAQAITITRSPVQLAGRGCMPLRFIETLSQGSPTENETSPVRQGRSADPARNGPTCACV